MSDENPRDPTTGELDCLAALWEAQEQGSDALKLSEIKNRIATRREQFGEPPPALTTVSTYLRSAAAKRLLDEVRLLDDGSVMPITVARSRGALSATRSPRTAYRPAFSPGAVFHRTFEAIIQAYPPGSRTEALADFARALGLSKEKVDAILGIATG